VKWTASQSKGKNNSDSRSQDKPHDRLYKLLYPQTSDDTLVEEEHVHLETPYDCGVAVETDKKYLGPVDP
jgi:hypothetical protein